MEKADEHGVKRWTVKHRVVLVLEILRGDTSSQEAARKHGLTVAEIEEWKERFLAGAENALVAPPAQEGGIGKRPRPFRGIGRGRVSCSSPGIGEGASHLRVSAALGTPSVRGQTGDKYQEDTSAGQCVKAAGQGARDYSPASRPKECQQDPQEQRAIYCGKDGWGHLAAVIDCGDREVAGFEFALRGWAGVGVGVPVSVRDVAPDRGDAHLAERQWVGLHQPQVPRGVPALPPLPGVHHALHARTERADRAILPFPQGGVRMATQLRVLRGGTKSNPRLDRLVQPRKAAPGTGVSLARRLPGEESRRGGGQLSGSTCLKGSLTKGGHYSFLPPYSPRPNIVEALRKKLKCEWSRARDYADKESPHDAVRRLLGQAGAILKIAFKAFATPENALKRI
jgi:hypothetical protein